MELPQGGAVNNHLMGINESGGPGMGVNEDVNLILTYPNEIGLVERQTKRSC